MAIDLNVYFESFVNTPIKSKITALDEYDAALDSYKLNKPPMFKEFVQFLSDKAGWIESNDKRANSHFGVDNNFVCSIDQRINELNELSKRISAEQFAISLDIIPQIIADESSKKEVEYMSGIEAEMEKVIREVEMLKAQIEASNKAENELYKQSVNEDNQIYHDLTDKKNQLLAYSDNIVNMCSMWGVSVSSIDIDNDTFTLDELSNLYDKYLQTLSREENSSNFVRAFRNKCPNYYMQMLVVLIILFLCYTPLLNVLSILFFGVIGLGQFKNKNKVKYYTVLAALLFRIDPSKMSSNEVDPDLLLPEEITDEMLDNDERFKGYVDLLEDIESRSEFKDSIVYQKALSEFAEKRPEYTKVIEEGKKVFDRKKKEILEDIVSEINYYKKKRQEAIDDYEKFGDRFNRSLVFDSLFTFGLSGEIDEEMVDVGSNNVIIRPSNNERMMSAFIQTMYINAVTHINPNVLKIHIFDPNGQGRVLMPTYNKDLDDIVIYHNESLQKITEELREIADLNLRTLRGYKIYEHNQRAMDEGISPITYNLLFILSQPKTVEDDEALNSFLNYSSDCGIMIWVVSAALESQNAFVFKRPFQGVDHPIGFINDDYCRRFSTVHVKKKKELEPKGGVLWVDFMKQLQKVMFENKDPFWTGNGSEFIDFYPGYRNGDPNDIPMFPFGNEGDIHMLGVGGTGAGKSVFINHCIATSTYIYSPKELELWLADFKGVEFKFYLGGEKFPAILPHIKACLCTADPDFATSLFQAFDDMSRFRYSEMMEAGVKNMPGWNDLVIKSSQSTNPIKKPEKLIELHSEDKNPYNPIWSMDDYWPRVLMIVDEFQVIFERADPKNLEKINEAITDISKVARAAGAHIFFTSQSMKKTVSADILNQFSLRFGLRCAMDTSQEIMGSKLSGLITAKNGWLYVKTVSIKPENAVFIKTPFIQDQEDKKYLDLTREAAGVVDTDDYITAAEKMHASPLHMHIAKCAQEALKRGMARTEPPVKYSESDECKFQYLVDFWNNKEAVKKFPKSGIFFMGDRMAYSTNQAPENIILGAKNNTHMFCLFEKIVDIPNFYKSIIYNIKHNRIEEELIKERGKGQTIAVHTANEDLGYLCYAEEDMSPACKSLYDIHVQAKDVIDWATKLFNYRKEHGVKDTPVWIICLDWNKAKGVGVDPDAMLKSRMDSLLNTCGEYNIHFIWICSGQGKIAAATLAPFGIRIGGSMSTDASLFLLGSRLANKNEPKNGWMYIQQAGEATRVKIYQSKFDRKVESDKIVL